MNELNGIAKGIAGQIKEMVKNPKSTQATARPWKKAKGDCGYIYGADGKTVVAVVNGPCGPWHEVGPIYEANAALIVQTVNSHDAMVEALRNAQEVLVKTYNSGTRRDEVVRGTIKRIEAALKLAEGK